MGPEGWSPGCRPSSSLAGRSSQDNLTLHLRTFRGHHSPPQKEAPWEQQPLLALVPGGTFLPRKPACCLGKNCAPALTACLCRCMEGLGEQEAGAP